MTIELFAEIRIRKPPATVFKLAAEEVDRLPELFTGLPPWIPAVVEVSLAGGTDEGLPQVGATRRIRMSDGSSMVERITEFEAPSRHAYEIDDLPFKNGLICRKLSFDWTIEPEDGSSRVRWRCRAEPRPLMGAPAKVMGYFLRLAMQRCLVNIADAFSN